MPAVIGANPQTAPAGACVQDERVLLLGLLPREFALRPAVAGVGGGELSGGRGRRAGEQLSGAGDAAAAGDAGRCECWSGGRV